jgi:hypothetical protein
MLSSSANSLPGLRKATVAAIPEESKNRRREKLAARSTLIASPLNLFQLFP